MNKILVIALSLCLTVFAAQAQSVIFPQEQQPGEARISVVQADAANEGAEDEVHYIIANDLFAADFLHADGVLRFNGCPELGLEPGTELFSL